MYITMLNPSVVQLLVSTATIGGVTILWFDFTVKAIKKVVCLSDEIFTDKVAEERKRRRKIEVRRRIREIIRREEAEKEEDVEDINFVLNFCYFRYSNRHHVRQQVC